MKVVVQVDPPVLGSSLVAKDDGIDGSTAADLYAAAAADVIRAADRSGGDPIVTYRAGEALPDDVEDGAAAARSLVDRAAPTGDVRLERGVGSTPAERLEHTVTQLLETEDATSVGVLSPVAPLVGRTHVDGAAMALRRNAVVVGPALAGRWHLCGFREPVEIADTLESTRPIVSLTDRARQRDLAVAFAPTLPTLATPAGLETTRAIVAARRTADRRYPEATAAVLSD